MNTTYIIGNGFDICQNMETRYCQFYKNHYTKLPTEGLSPAVKEFREEITKYIEDNNKEKALSNKDIDWSDLESAFGRYAERLKEAQDYIDIILDINKELRNYIEIQDKKFTITEKEASKIYIDFCKPDVTPYLSYEDSQAMLQFKRNNGAEKIEIINFNYTNTIEKIVDSIKSKLSATNIVNYSTSINQVLHIHSRLGSDSAILVGVNDPSQIYNEKFRIDRNIIDVLVKPETNRMFGNGKIAQANVLMNQAQVFVLFGVSVGETDKMWWELIGKILQEKNARLIWFVFESPGVESPLLIGRKKRELINKFCKTANIPKERIDKISSKIYIGYNTNIFKTKTEIKY